MIEKSLYHLLKTDLKLSARVAERIYPDVIPQDAALPAVMLQRISSEFTHSTQGFSGLVISRFQITAVCDLHHEAAELGEIIRSTIDSYQGTVLGVEIQGIFALNVSDVPQIDPETKIQTAMARRMDFRVCFTQS